MKNIKEITEFDGRKITLIWHNDNVILSNIKITQVSGFCVDRENKVLIVKVKNERNWRIPGGHPEEGETLEQTLIREINEEGAVGIKSIEMLGFVEVIDPDNSSIEGTHYLQIRFIALITDVKNFKTAFETDERKFVPVNELPVYIPWLKSLIGQAQYKSFLAKLQHFHN
jgi:ADP-ribose pyrophosphatase YjhB (NUDIX family)